MEFLFFIPCGKLPQGISAADLRLQACACFASFPPSLRFQTDFASLKKPFHFLFALLFCLQLVGGPYAVLQIYAWGTMITAYTKESGILKGTRDTFSGEKPCHLCCKITEAKKADAEKKREAPTPTSPTKLSQEFLAARDESLVPPISESLPPVTFFGHLFQDRTSTKSPSIPPPKQRA